MRPPTSGEPPPSLWGNFIFDEQLAHPKYDVYKNWKLFRLLVEDHVPNALSSHWDSKLTMVTIILAQRTAILEFQRNLSPANRIHNLKFIENKLLTTKVPEDENELEFFLCVRDTTEEAYCLQWPGLRDQDYAAMKDGRAILGEVYSRHPAFFFRELLPKKAATNS